MPPLTIFKLKFETSCGECGKSIGKGQYGKRLIDRSFICLECAPVTQLEPGTAEGAVDSRRNPRLRAKGGIAMPTHDASFSYPGKRRRLPMHLRRKQQQYRNNT